jgi:type IV secretion system protein VirB9
VKGFPSVVELPKGEKILDIAIGGLSDWSTAWEIVKRDSAFYIKPLAPAQLTTLIVGTTERNYIFDLQALPATPQNDAKRLSRLVLIRPPPAVAVEAPAAALQAIQTNEVIRHTEEQVEQIEGQIKALREERFAKRPRNYDYTLEVVSMVDDIKPTEAFDDGRFTYLKFPNGLQIPAAYRGGLTATDETLTNSHIEDDYLVLHGVHTAWVLRLGGSVVGIHNEKFSAEGAATQSGTSTTATRVLQ